MFVVKKRMVVLVQLQILYFVVKKTNGNLDATSDFLICLQKANDRFGIIFKISYFAVKERMVEF